MSDAPFQRVPESCPYRRLSPGDHTAACQLLGDILPTTLPEFRLVSDDMCLACCRSFLPSERDWNPVIASLVWNLSDRTLSHRFDGADVTNPESWTRLRDRAEVCLPVVLSDEDDLPERPIDWSICPSDQSVDRISAVIPRPSIRVGHVTRWAVGVTTAPRRSPTLSHCLNSLISAGWPAPHLFIDGSVEIAVDFQHLPRSVRLPLAGARQSYYLTVAELLDTYPSADALLLVQDDAWWPKGLPVREYLESCLWPESEECLVSAWCCSDDTAETAGWHRRMSPWKFGAVAFIFSRTAALRFITDPEVRNACASHTDSHMGGISSLIGNWAVKAHIPVYFTTPSLVQHLGEVSTIWENSRAVGVRWASRFLGDELHNQQPCPVIVHDP